MIAQGSVTEVMLLHQAPAARIRCPAGAAPTAGQYTLAHADGSDAPLATALFAARSSADGFIAAAPVPAGWLPGTVIWLRGPLGRGFALPAAARRVALVALHCPPVRLLALLEQATRQQAAAVLVAEEAPEDLAPQVEAQPLKALHDIAAWADYIAFDLTREELPELKERMKDSAALLKAEAQALVRVPMPCGALAACGVCTVDVGGKALLACEDGPVFDFRQLMGWSRRA